MFGKLGFGKSSTNSNVALKHTDPRGVMDIIDSFGFVLLGPSSGEFVVSSVIVYVGIGG